MAHILVVDDSPMERRVITLLLSQKPDLITTEAENARDALGMIRRDLPDLVITDLMMPDMDGMELIEAIRADYPGLPVILTTAYGSEETVVRALREGAVSYVSKQDLAEGLVSTVTGVLEMAHWDRQEQRITAYRTYTESRYVLNNDTTLIQPLIGQLRNELVRMQLCDDNGLFQVAISLNEALTNAIYHGNLELNSDLRQKNQDAYKALAEERRAQPPYRDRRIHVTAKLSRLEAIYIIRDEGPGFKPSAVGDPTDPENLEKLSGRGLLLIRTFMDSVSYNGKGNEITMTLKKRTCGGG